MKKHKILIVALAMAVMCTGAGYAYWTQSLTINNTVNTGNMDVGFVCYGDDAWDDGWISGNHSDLVTLGLTRTTNKQQLDFTVGNFYPGAGASLDFVVQNTGTVAAKITNIAGSITENPALCDALDYTFNEVVVYDFLGVPVYKEIINVNADNVSALASGLTNALDDIIIQPNHTLVLKANGLLGSGQVAAPGYEILMPSTITGNDFESQTAKFSLGLNFTQVN